MAAIVATTASRAYGQQVLNEAALGRLEQRIRDSTLYQRDEELDAELMRQLGGLRRGRAPRRPAVHGDAADVHAAARP
jgi:hypothetical protein